MAKDALVKEEPKIKFDEQIRLIIFDFDGTLAELHVDWEPLVNQVWEDFLVPMGIGKTDELIYHVMERHRDDLGSLYDQLAAMFASVEVAAEYSVCEEGMELLKSARTQGLRVALHSSNSRKILNRFMKERGLEGKLVPVVGFEDVDRHKPDPEGLRIILDHHGLVSKPHHALFIGDSSHDEDCAKALGVPFRQVGERKY